MENSKKGTYIVAAISLIIVVSVIYFLFIRTGSQKDIKIENSASEVQDVQKLEVEKRPFVTLTPTSDGAEIIISIEKMQEFDKIEYEITYLAANPQIAGEKIQRGSTGTDVNPKDEKYKKNILLGTASRGVRSPDKDIADGKLALHLFKGDTEFLSETNWDMLNVGLTKKEIRDRDGNFTMSLPNLKKDYWVIVADTVGVPPRNTFDIKSAILPIYGTFSTTPSFSTPATVSIKTDKMVEKVFVYNHQDSSWKEADSQAKDGKISFKTSSFSTYLIVSSK